LIETKTLLPVISYVIYHLASSFFSRIV